MAFQQIHKRQVSNLLVWGFCFWIFFFFLTSNVVKELKTELNLVMNSF